MKRILYGMGPLDTCWMASLESFNGLTDSSDQDPSIDGSPHPKIEKNEKIRQLTIISLFTGSGSQKKIGGKHSEGEQC